MQTVTARRAGVLRLVVDEYVETALPVPSARVRDKLGVPVSAATIRNEMQALEEEGLLTHPHTSAGRIPSDAGYRFYVEALMGPVDVGEDEKRTIRHQFYQAAPELDEWGQLAAVLLSRSLGLLAIVTAPRSRDLRVRRLELIALRDPLALVVVVLREARVLKQLVSLQASFDQAQLSALSGRVNAQVAGRTARELRAVPWPEGGPESTVAGAVLHLLDEEAAHEAEAHVEGLAAVLDQPEFQADHGGFLQIVTALEQHALQRVVSAQMLSRGGVSVVIGEENRAQEMRPCSVVVAPYGTGLDAAGFVGVIGPTRMRYGSAVAGVRHLAGIMQEMMLTVYD